MTVTGPPHKEHVPITLSAITISFRIRVYVRQRAAVVGTVYWNITVPHIKIYNIVGIIGAYFKTHIVHITMCAITAIIDFSHEHFSVCALDIGQWAETRYGEFVWYYF